jgi:hypothetical protein
MLRDQEWLAAHFPALRVKRLAVPRPNGGQGTVLFRLVCEQDLVYAPLDLARECVLSCSDSSTSATLRFRIALSNRSRKPTVATLLWMMWAHSNSATIS